MTCPKLERIPYRSRNLVGSSSASPAPSLVPGTRQKQNPDLRKECVCLLGPAYPQKPKGLLLCPTSPKRGAKLPWTSGLSHWFTPVLLAAYPLRVSAPQNV